ncbi:hypothetical protein Tco_1290219, partial [Tanacetum coccineum]
HKNLLPDKDVGSLNAGNQEGLKRLLEGYCSGAHTTSLCWMKPSIEVDLANEGLKVHIRPCQKLVKHLAIPMCLSPFAKRIRIHNYRKVKCKAFVSDEPISSTQLEFRGFGSLSNVGEKLGSITSGRVAEYLGRTIGTGTIGNGLELLIVLILLNC